MATKSPKAAKPKPALPLPDLGIGHRDLLDLNLKRRLDFLRTPELFYPGWRRCTVMVLLVTDGSLNFGEGDFGLSTFVRTMKNEAPGRGLASSSPAPGLTSRQARPLRRCDS